MPGTHVHENHNAEGTSDDSFARLLADLLPIPLLFALLLVAWPLLLGGPAPWWVIWGAAWYGAMAAWAVGRYTLAMARAGVKGRGASGVRPGG